MFVGPGTEVYEGMIVGENSRVGRHGRQRHQGEEADEHARRPRATCWCRLIPHRQLSLEQALEFCREDECVEVTPATVRLRKVVLDQTEREKLAPAAAADPDHPGVGAVHRRNGTQRRPWPSGLTVARAWTATHSRHDGVHLCAVAS